MGKIASEHWVKAELAVVFAFFSEPQNLPRLMPASLDVRVTSDRAWTPVPEHRDRVVQSGLEPGTAVAAGSRLEISFRYVPFLCFRGRWIAEIIEYEPPFCFVDEQRSGPMRKWRHRHIFRSEVRDGVSGTVIRDEVAYELPLGRLGRFADALFVERGLQAMFRSRQQQLEKLLFA